MVVPPVLLVLLLTILTKMLSDSVVGIVALTGISL
jgi:hypothetical protein